MGVNAPPRAFVLAAGAGTRLRPLTGLVPKPLLPVANVPVLFFALALLRRAGIREVGVNLHHHAEKIPALLGDGSKLGLSVRYFREDSLLGTGGAIRNARGFLQGMDFVLLNGDTVLDLDLAALIAFHRERGGIASLAVSSRASAERFGGVSFGHEGRLGRLVERGCASPEGEEAAVFAGAAVLGAGILANLEGAGEAPCVLRHGVFPLVRKGRQAFAFRTAGYFADIGSPRRYLQANLEVFGRNAAPELYREALELWERLAPPRRPPHIEEGAVVGPEVVLGSGARIGRGARVEKAVLWEGTAIGAGMRVGEAIVFRGEEILPILFRGRFKTTP